MIVVYGARNRDNQRSSDFIEMAKGQQDEYGNAFEVVTLQWLGRVNHPGAKTHGFEDAIIRRGGTTMGLNITYRKPGCVQWYPNAAGVYEALCPKTPWNMKRLAETHADKLWQIKEPHIRMEVELLAKKIEDDLTDEERKFHQERRRDLHRSPHEKAEDNRLPTNRELQIQAKLTESDRMDLASKSRELARKEQELAERQRLLDEREMQMVKDGGGPTVKYRREAVQSWHPTRIRKLLREEFGIDVPATGCTREKAIERLMEAQGVGVSSSDVPEPKGDEHTAEVVTG